MADPLQRKSEATGAPVWLRLPRPESDGHKYDRGHAVVVSGAAHSTGAARLAASAALRIGAGLVTVACGTGAVAVNAAHLTAIMLAVTDEPHELAHRLADDRISAVAIGMGLGLDERARQLVLAVLASGRPAVLDADALTMFRDDPSKLFHAIASPTVITPHAGEFARLFPTTGSRCDRANAAAVASGAVVVLKGPQTIIASPDGNLYRNDHATPWLATAGSGDVLAGLICGLLAQGMMPFKAARAAVWIHGELGLRAGPGLISEDLPNLIPGLLRDMHQDLPPED